MDKIIGVITGDIIDSRKKASPKWLAALKDTLSSVFPNEKYQVFRGDSFQIIIEKPDESLLKCILLTSAFRRNGQPAARLAIGIGTYDYLSESASESNGEAFIYSGKLMDHLTKEKITMGMRSSWPDLDNMMNTVIQLGLIAMNNWTKKEAEIIYELFDNPGISQTQLSNKLDKSQSTISERIKRSYYQELEMMETLFRKQLQLYIDLNRQT